MLFVGGPTERGKCIEAIWLHGHQSWRKFIPCNNAADSRTLKSNFLCMKAAYYDGNAPTEHKFLSIISTLC